MGQFYLKIALKNHKHFELIQNSKYLIIKRYKHNIKYKQDASQNFENF